MGEDEVFSFDLIKTDLLLSDVTEVLVCRLYTTTIIFYWNTVSPPQCDVCFSHYSVKALIQYVMTVPKASQLDEGSSEPLFVLWSSSFMMEQPVSYVFICMMAHYICMNDGNRDCNYILYVVPLKMLYVHFLELSL